MKIHVLRPQEWGNTVSYMKRLQGVDGYTVMGHSKNAPVADGDFIVLPIGDDVHVFKAKDIEMYDNPADSFNGKIIRPGEDNITPDELAEIEKAVEDIKDKPYYVGPR